MDKFILKVRRTERKGVGNVIRISVEAMDTLEELQSRTGHAISFIASEMIAFADEHCIVKDDK